MHHLIRKSSYMYIYWLLTILRKETSRYFGGYHFTTVVQVHSKFIPGRISSTDVMVSTRMQYLFFAFAQEAAVNITDTCLIPAKQTLPDILPLVYCDFVHGSHHIICGKRGVCFGRDSMKRLYYYWDIIRV